MKILLLFPLVAFSFSFNEKNYEKIKEKYKKGIDSAIENPSVIKDYLYEKNIKPFKEIPDLLNFKEYKEYFNRQKIHLPKKKDFLLNNKK